MSVFFDWRRRRRKLLLATNISLLLRSPAAFAILQCYAFMLFSPQVNMCKHNDLRKKKMQPYGLSRIAFRGGEEEIRPTAKRAKQISQSETRNGRSGVIAVMAIVFNIVSKSVTTSVTLKM